MLQHGASSLVKTAGAVSLSALTAWMCCMEGLASMAKPVEEKKEPRPAQEKGKSLREHEPRPVKGDARENEPALQHEVRDHEPTSSHCSPEGSPVAPRLCAVRAPPFGPTPWESAEFNQPPYAANDDLWISLNDGWVVRVHRSLRSRLFHPIHRSCPVRIEDLEARRICHLVVRASRLGTSCAGGSVVPWPSSAAISRDGPMERMVFLSPCRKCSKRTKLLWCAPPTT